MLGAKDQPDELFLEYWHFNVDGVDISDGPSSNVAVGETESHDADVDVSVLDGLRRSDRVRSAPDRYGEWMEYASLAVNGEDEPQSYSEAMRGKFRIKWKEATDSEYDSLIKNKTWDLVNLTCNANVVGCRWVFKTKHGPDGEVNRFKARLVAQGFSQLEGIDYKEVFAPVVRYDSVRTVLAIANQLDLELHQMDVKCAFLNGHLEEEINMTQPEGYEDEEHPDFVGKLNRSLYGLKQSARCWNKVIDEYLKSENYEQNSTESCIYFKMVKKGDKLITIIIALYVDDTIIASNDINTLKEEKLNFSQRFEMDDHGELHYLLGMCVKRDRKKKILTVDQRQYLMSVLDRFGMKDCKSVSTPMENGGKFKKLLVTDEAIETLRYQAVIGSLIYASICTRPDLSYSMGALSQFMSKPGTDHWVASKRILRYIKGSLNLGLVFIHVMILNCMVCRMQTGQEMRVIESRILGIYSELDVLVFLGNRRNSLLLHYLLLSRVYCTLFCYTTYHLVKKLT